MQLSYSAEHYWWEGDTTFPSGHPLRVILFPGEDAQAVLPDAQRAVHEICQREREIHLAVVSGLLDTYNQSHKTAPLSDAELIDRIQQQMASLQLYAPLNVDEACVLYFFDDGTIFVGDWIEVTFSPDSEILHVGFVG